MAKVKPEVKPEVKKPYEKITMVDKKGAEVEIYPLEQENYSKGGWEIKKTSPDNSTGEQS